MSRTRLARLLLSCVALTLLSGCASIAPELPADSDIPPHKRIETYEPASQPRDATDDASAGTNIRVNQDSSGRNQNETTFAINPIDPDNMIGGANDARFGSWASGYYYTLDGGATWSDGVMPERKYPNQGDPTLAYCGDGTIVFGYLDYTAAYQPHRLIVGRSDDGGQSWSGFGTVYEGSWPFADKPYIACAPDDGSFYANRAYISWTHFSSSSPIRVAYSTTRGTSWTGYSNVSGSGVQGSVPVAGKNGEVYVFWLGNGIRFAKSTNGGGTWSGEALVSSVTGIGNSPHFRRNSFPSAGIDVSGGEHDGNVYVVWADSRNGDPDIYFTRSTDGGASWDEPFRVNDDPVGNARDQFFPWLAVDDAGLVHVMWHDQRDDGVNTRFHVYIASSRDGGASFDRNLRVSDVASDGSLTNFLGDYAAIGAQHGMIVPLWSDLRPGTGEEDAYIEIEEAFAYDIVDGVSFDADKRTLRFVDQSPRLGPSVVYDALVGDVSDLAETSRASNASCAANDLATPELVYEPEPVPGEAIYLLLRAQGPRGEGSWGSGSTHPDARDTYDDESPCS